jgi:uncharacterized protein involved in type VI secretion and phage assembly
VSAALFESVARIARHEAGAVAQPAVGKVTATFGASGSPPDHAVTVDLRDSGLVLPRVPIAVGALGLAALPAVGDLVLVVFLGGDPNAPVVVGRLYTDAVAPPGTGTDGKLALALPAGAQTPALDLLVDGAAPTVTFQLGDQDPVKLTADDKKLVIEAGQKLKLTIDTAGGGRLELGAGTASVLLKEDGDVTVKTAGTLKLEGDKVEITGNSKVTVKGSQVEIN